MEKGDGRRGEKDIKRINLCYVDIQEYGRMMKAEKKPLRSGVQMLDYSNVRKRRGREVRLWDRQKIRSKSGRPLRVKRDTSTQQEEAANGTFSLSPDSQSGRVAQT